MRAAYLEQLYLVKFNPRINQDFKIPEMDKIKDFSKNFQQLADVLKHREDVVLLDTFAYNILIQESRIDKWQSRLVTCTSFMAYSQTALDTMKDIVSKLKLKKYSIQVYRPLLEKYGESFKLVVNDTCLLTVYTCNFCLPCKCWESYQIGSYHVILRMFYILKFCSIRESKNDFNKYCYMINHLQFAREMWLRRHHKIGIEKNLFQELQVSCLGSGFVSQKSMADDRLLQNKRFKYFPNKVNESELKKYVYPNTSGRIYKIIDEKDNVKLVNSEQSQRE